jgi:hypothetical protein
MREGKSAFLHKIIDSGAETARSFSKERQISAQAFNLHIERRDGRHAEGFAWSHYVGYQWKDEGEQEKLTVVFGERIVEIEGHNLGVLVTEIRDGQLNGIRELAGGQNALLRQANPDNEPIIASVRSYPDFDEMVKRIKGGGENDDKARHARRIER